MQKDECIEYAMYNMRVTTPVFFCTTKSFSSPVGPIYLSNVKFSKSEVD